MSCLTRRSASRSSSPGSSPTRCAAPCRAARRQRPGGQLGAPPARGRADPQLHRAVQAPQRLGPPSAGQHLLRAGGPPSPPATRAAGRPRPRGASVPAGVRAAAAPPRPRAAAARASPAADQPSHRSHLSFPHRCLGLRPWRRSSGRGRPITRGRPPASPMVGRGGVKRGRPEGVNTAGPGNRSPTGGWNASVGVGPDAGAEDRQRVADGAAEPATRRCWRRG